MYNIRIIAFRHRIYISEIEQDATQRKWNILHIQRQWPGHNNKYMTFMLLYNNKLMFLDCQHILTALESILEQKHDMPILPLNHPYRHLCAHCIHSTRTDTANLILCVCVCLPAFACSISDRVKCVHRCSL